MMQPEIYILTGAIHSGKTTQIVKWAEHRSNVNGIVTPVVDGQRMFMDIAEKNIFAMEASVHEKKIVSVGKYIFSEDAFNKAEMILIDALQHTAIYLVVDEIGPLELNAKGFYTALKKILQNCDSSNTIIAVVRQNLVEEVINFFEIKNYTVVQNMDVIL